MASLAGVLKPEYLFRPQQISKKLWRECVGRKRETKKASLPWGLKINVNTGEDIGWSVYTRALYETAVVESLWRLARAGDLVIDVGANIGYMTSVLAVKVGSSGTIHSFEPHPSIFQDLSLNVENWRLDGRCGRFVLHNAALGSHKGVGQLHVPDNFSLNQGTSWIGAAPFDDKTIDVAILALDDVIPENESVGVVKLDVQGYELQVLKGMERLLRGRQIRHIVFEEEAALPAPTHEFLSDLGYTSYGIEQRLTGIRFSRNRQPSCETPNYLATILPEANVMSLSKGFWQSFGPLAGG